MPKAGLQLRALAVTVVAGMLLGSNATAMTPTERPRPGSFRHRVGADAGGLRSYEEIHAALIALAKAHPQLTRLETIGHSVEGRPLLALRIADDPDDPTRPTVQLVAAHHANEASTPEPVLDAAQILLSRRDQEPYATWLEQMTLVVVPMVNPDGSHVFWEIDARLGRKNRRHTAPGQRNPGVDLNRNYSFHWDGPESRFSSRDPKSSFFRGAGPASEPEVRAMMGLAERVRPVALISYHAAATRLLVPYAIAAVSNPEPSAAWAVARRMLEQLPHSFDGRRYRTRRALYSVTGIEKDWYHHRFGTLAYVMELPFRRPRNQRLRESVEHSRGAWMTLFARWLEGPSLSVRAIDEDGAPAHARVSFDEIATRAGEQWTTDPIHGWFHCYLPAAGSYTVRLRTGDVEVARSVVVESGWTRVEIPMIRTWAVVAAASR